MTINTTRIAGTQKPGYLLRLWRGGQFSLLQTKQHIDIMVFALMKHKPFL